MARPVVTEYVARNEQIAQRYRAGTTLRQLAQEYGLEKGRIKVILRDLGLVVRPEPRAADPERRAIDDRLVLIGFRIRSFQLETGLSRLALAARLRLSERKILDAVQGKHDWRYSELLHAAQGMNLAIDELTGPAKSGVPMTRDLGHAGRRQDVSPHPACTPYGNDQTLSEPTARAD